MKGNISMKTKLLVLLLVVLSLCVVLVSCGEKGCEDGVHTLDEGVVTKAPDCITEGIRTKTCTVCGETVDYPEPKSDEVHRFNVGVVTTEPGCLVDGVRTISCILCGKQSTTVEPATGAHSWGEYVETKTPTCGIAGEKVKTCNVCDTEHKEAVPATGLHKFDEGTVKTEATCAAAGVRVRTCTNEGCGITRETPIPATGVHEAGSTYKFNDDKHYNTCVGCDRPMNEATHQWDEGEIVTPTEGCKAGVKRATCTVCGHSSDVAVPSTVPHTSSCEIDKENKIIRYACSVCGEGYSYTIGTLYDMEDDSPLWRFDNSGGAAYSDTTAIRNVAVEGEGGNHYMSLTVAETLTSAVQVQHRGMIPISGATDFVFGFDIKAASASNDTTLEFQFFNTGTSDWSAGRGQKFMKFTGMEIVTTQGLSVATLSADEWVSFRMEVSVTDSNIVVNYFLNNTLVGTENLSNNMYQKTIMSLYAAGQWQTLGSGYYFDNVIIATK